MKHNIQRFWYPCLFIGIGIVAGLLPSEADGAALATVPNSGWMILSIWMIGYGVGVLIGMAYEKKVMHGNVPSVKEGNDGNDIERSYCLICRRELMTEAGHICPSCANKVLCAECG